jgi:hypothetical protein
MKKILAPILFTLCILAFGIGHEPRARAQVLGNTRLVIGAQVDFDPAKLFDPSTLVLVGTVEAKDDTETWKWQSGSSNLQMFAIWQSNETVKFIGNNQTIYQIDDVPSPEGCGTSYLPKPRAGSEVWAVYNALKGEAPKLVGVRYLSPRGDELWYVSDDYKYGGEPYNYLIVVKDGTVERDPSWTHTIRVMR